MQYLSFGMAGLLFQKPGTRRPEIRQPAAEYGVDRSRSAAVSANNRYPFSDRIFRSGTAHLYGSAGATLISLSVPRHVAVSAAGVVTEFPMKPRTRLAVAYCTLRRAFPTRSKVHPPRVVCGGARRRLGRTSREQ